jgi:hypothetical protein
MEAKLLACITLTVWAISEVVIVVRTNLLRRHTERHKSDKGSHWLIRGAVYMAVVVCVSFHSFGWGTVLVTAARIGSAVTILGVTLRLWSVYQLGKGVFDNGVNRCRTTAGNIRSLSVYSAPVIHGAAALACFPRVDLRLMARFARSFLHTSRPVWSIGFRWKNRH